MNKYFLNTPETCVDDFLQGFIYTHSGLIQLLGHRVVLRNDLHEVAGKVSLLSGGGAGHEPAHAGYVGKGMLSGSISGAVFTSPPPSSIIAAIKHVNIYKPEGIILIVTNYTGDRLNFGLAREWALSENIKVEMVVVGEDCAFRSDHDNAGRRGLAGTVLIHKIAGALAEQGTSLNNVLDTLKEVIHYIGTIGVCLRPCVLPNVSNTSFELGESEMELGLGIHGEAGVKKEKLGSCSEVIEVMLNHMSDSQSSARFPLIPKAEVAVLVNNLGGTSNLEMGIVTKEVVQSLENRGLTIKRLYSGAFMTSLQMAGISVTILNLSLSTRLPLLPLLDMDTTVAVPITTVRSSSLYGMALGVSECDNLQKSSVTTEGPIINSEQADKLKRCIEEIVLALKANETKLNDYDTGSGDGDCGSTHARGAKGIEKAFGEGVDYSRPATVLQRIGHICSEEMGGSSGALYSIFMAAAARYLITCPKFTVLEFAAAFELGLISVKKYGGAQPGDRTMIDVLQPISESLFTLQKETLQLICIKLKSIGDTAAKSTLQMKAKAGRASYVSVSELKHPDPGAEAIALMVGVCTKILSE